MIVPRLKCDILGRYATEAKPVRKVRLLVQIEYEGEWTTDKQTSAMDMCPAALERAIHFVDRAITPPTERKAAGDA